MPPSNENTVCFWEAGLKAAVNKKLTTCRKNRGQHITKVANCCSLVSLYVMTAVC